MSIELTDGQTVEGITDGKWRWVERDSDWPGDLLGTDLQRGFSRVRLLEAESYSDHGDYRNFDTYGPRCAEIPGEHWVIYVPAALPIEVSGLPAGRVLDLKVFNPVTGEQADPVEVQVDAAGAWRAQPPLEGGDRVLHLSVQRTR